RLIMILISYVFRHSYYILFVRRYFFFNFFFSSYQSITISPLFSAYIIPFFSFTFSSGICSPSAYFLTVLQLILWISAISLVDNDLSFLKNLIELIPGIVSIPFNIHCFDSASLNLEYYLYAGKPFLHAALCTFILSYTGTFR